MVKMFCRFSPGHPMVLGLGLMSVKEIYSTPVNLLTQPPDAKIKWSYCHSSPLLSFTFLACASTDVASYGYNCLLVIQSDYVAFKSCIQYPVEIRYPNHPKSPLDGVLWHRDFQCHIASWFWFYVVSNSVRQLKTVILIVIFYLTYRSTG